MYTEDNLQQIKMLAKDS